MNQKEEKKKMPVWAKILIIIFILLFVIPFILGFLYGIFPGVQNTINDEYDKIQIEESSE